jgi:hypothetical protein
MGGEEGRQAAEALATFCNAWEAGGLSETIAVTADAAHDGEAPGMRRRKLTLTQLRAVLARNAELEAENARMREELEAWRSGAATRIEAATGMRVQLALIPKDLCLAVLPGHAVQCGRRAHGETELHAAVCTDGSRWEWRGMPSADAPSEPGRVRAERDGGQR